MDTSSKYGAAVPTGISGPPARVVLTGSSGFLGTALAARLRAAGHELGFLVRRAPRGAAEARWEPAGGILDPRILAGAGAVIHLAGANLAAGRWTAARRREILDSRVSGTGLLARTLSGMPEATRPRVLISMSAVGIYGSRSDEELDETSHPGTGFLARVVEAWEAAAAPALAAGIRVVHPRTGLVMGRQGGALAAMLPIFRLGLGGRLGSGRQWMSIISLRDWCRAILWCITRAELSGPVNVACPTPLTNADFTRALGAALHRPTPCPVPTSLLRLGLGAVADEALLASLRVTPRRLLATGFRFEDATAEQAIEAALGAER